MRHLAIFFTILLALTLVQCTENPLLTEDNHGVNLNKGPGNGGSKGGGNGGGDGDSQDYGDLIVCLRDADGIPIYEMISGEHGDTYYALPIKFDASTLNPVVGGVSYATFELNLEGEVIPEAGYIVKEVEFGRLKLVRSPQSVLDRAIQEAKKSLTQSGVTDIKTDASGRLVAIIGEEDWIVDFDLDPNNDEGNDKTIDSPRENMAIYQELMTYGLTNQLGFLNAYFDPNDILILASSAVAAGADKTGNINVDEIAYMNDWLLGWEYIEYLGPDAKDRRYFNFGNMVYDRQSTYGDKYVKITTLYPDGSWTEETVSLLDVVSWTAPERLIDYTEGSPNTKITGFADAADDAVQVLEYIHSSDLIVYNPYFLP